MTKLFLTISILALTINLYSQDNSATKKTSNTYPALMDKEFSQGSNIVFPELSERLILDLACLGKVWGFLKYNHPQIAKGTYNWDFELFRFLPKFLAAKDITIREGLMLDWINSLGDISKYPKAKNKSRNSFAKPNLDWIESLITNQSLKVKLYQVYERRNQGEHFYVGSNPEVPTFLNEDPYANLGLPDDAFRLLSLYKYWNIIQYYFPYKHLTDKNWDSVLIEYIPYFLGTKNRLEYELAVLKIIGEVNDTHAGLWDGANEFYRLKGWNYPPFHVRFVENKLIVDDYFNTDKAALTGIKIGDVITHINGKSVEKIVDSLLNYFPGSNLSARLRDLSYDMLRSANTEVVIEYITGDTLKKTKLTLYNRQELDWYDWFKLKNQKGINLLTNDILYLNLAFLNENDTPAIEELLKKVKSVIVDVRNYPNLMAMYSLLPCFQTTKKPFAVFADRNINNPGEFYWTKSVRMYGNKKPFSGNLLVLENELTQSLGEYTVMAFKATGNATVIGSQTAGADGRIGYIFLPGGLKTSISGRGVYYPDKTETQRIGIVPDVEVKPTIKGIQEGRDEVLEKAIEMIEKISIAK
ncbi:MAG: S41 family peptidase [Leadbetterella sp.]|nr:S41 family peptidase [Leadbetterella sp.]